METVGVVIGIFGDKELWMERSKRAYASAQRQTVSPQFVYVSYGATLSEARNLGADLPHDVDWLIFLDADDELDSHYIEHMLKGTGDVRQPSTLGVYEDGSEDEYPVLIPAKPSLLIGNHLVIGSMVRKELFDKVGGFRELPILEDWDLWIRCWLNGAEFGACPEAIYRVHVSTGVGRNTNRPGLHSEVYQMIQESYTLGV